MREEIPTETLTNTNAHVQAWREYQTTKPASERVHCANWDDQSMVAHPIYLGDFTVIGILQPVDYELVARSPGIQPWSQV